MSNAAQVNSPLRAMRRYVFVSHADGDKPRLKPLIEILLDAGIPLWIDRPEEIGLGERHLNCGRILAGADWQQQIHRALENTSCVLFVLSRASNSGERSDELFREFEFGKSRDMLVMAQIEVIDRAELNPFFRIRQVIDLATPMAEPDSRQAMPAKFEVLVDRLRDHLMTDERSLDPAATTSGLVGSPPAQRTGARTVDSAHVGLSRPPRLLPYLTNRHEQQRRLTQVLQAQVDRKTIRPVTFFTVGCEDECVDAFVEQLRYVRLPEFLRANGLPGDVLFRALQWPGLEAGGTPLPEEEPAQQFLDVESQVRDVLGVTVTAERALVEKKLANPAVCCCFHISIGLDEWGARQRRLLRCWLEWWASMDLSRASHPVVTIVCIVYPPGLLRRFWSQRALKRVRHDIEEFSSETERSSAVYALPELRSVRFEDVEQWIREHVDGVDREMLRRRLRKHFSRALSFRPRRLSMYKTAMIVKAALSDPAVRVVTP